MYLNLAQRYLAGHDGSEGVLFVGRAQEKTNVLRAQKRRNPVTGKTYPWLVADTAMVNHFYFYAFDDDFGPFFIKFATYFPYTAKVRIQRPHWAQRQAAKAGIDFEALDNGSLSRAGPTHLQRICDRLGPGRIDRFVRKWLARLPHPYTSSGRRAGYRYDISVLQAEFSLAQVLDRSPPRHRPSRPPRTMSTGARKTCSTVQKSFRRGASPRYGLGEGFWR